MEKSKFLMIVIVFLLILNFGTLALLFFGRGHGRPNHRPPNGKEGPARFIISALKFDEKQEAAFNDLKKEHQGQMRMMEDSMRTQRELLPDLIITGNKVKADSIANNIGKFQKQIEMYTFDHFVKVNALCNDEQKKKFKNIIGDILKMMAPHKSDPLPR